MSAYDDIVPKEKWEFDESVADCFENMLERSIPQYSVMRKAVSDLCYNMIVTPNIQKTVYNILDIGCSDGLMIDQLIKRFNNYGYGYFTGIDVSEAMLNKARMRFKDYMITDDTEKIVSKKVNIELCDLRTDFPDGLFDIITAILTIQFTPIEYRQHIIQNVYNNLSNTNGCFIMVEKVLGNTDKINKLFIKEYYKKKEENGYSQEQIDRKRLSLEGVLVPVTNDWNIDLLKQAGFRQVDVFWRWMNFVGYIALK